MDVAVSNLRAHLSEWLERARRGEEILVTERGVPIARLTGISASDTLERLTAEGVIGKPGEPSRPRATSRRRVRAQTPIADLISDQRG